MEVTIEWYLALSVITGNLDSLNKDAIFELLFATCKSANATLIVATHDTARVDRFDRSIAVDAGEVRA